MQELLKKYPPSAQHTKKKDIAEKKLSHSPFPKTPQAQLDLHNGGLLSENITLSEQFLFSAKSKHLRKVRIITGRGINSPGGKPVLKPKIEALLKGLTSEHVIKKFQVYAGHFDIFFF